MAFVTRHTVGSCKTVDVAELTVQIGVRELAGFWGPQPPAVVLVSRTTAAMRQRQVPS